QVDYLEAGNCHAEFFLTQVVSHHRLAPAARFIEAAERRSLSLPGLYGVFFYRSANRRTLETLQSFLPVPINDLTAEFSTGATAEDVCARTIRALMGVGARHFYISNLPIERAQDVLAKIREKLDSS